MRVSKRFILVSSLFLTVLCLKTGDAQQAGEAIQSRELKYQSEVVRSMLEFRKSLEELSAIYENDLRKQRERLEILRGLFKKEIISRLELDESENAAASAELRLGEVRRRIAEEDIALTEAVAREELLKQGPRAAGDYSESAALIRYEGAARWSLADVPQVEAFFVGKFGRGLPISALGQTPVHDRMKFEHSHAIDVAVHPDSAEGRALMAYLRDAGIPFLAFRGKIPGAATGAHIHIGPPSVRALPE